MKFKEKQIVYFYKSEGPYIGVIESGRIISATKDIYSKVTVYEVEYFNDCFSGALFGKSTVRLYEDQLYTSKKKAEKEHKDEIAYGQLSSKLEFMEKLLDKVIKEYQEPLTTDPIKGYTLSVDPNLTPNSIYIEGVGDLREEINKLKSEIEDIKKKIKKPTKKVVKKEN